MEITIEHGLAIERVLERAQKAIRDPSSARLAWRCATMGFIGYTRVHRMVYFTDDDEGWEAIITFV